MSEGGPNVSLPIGVKKIGSMIPNTHSIHVVPVTTDASWERLDTLDSVDESMDLVEIHCNVLDIVDEVASSGHYASFEMICHVLLDRYSVESFDDLGISAQSVPSLAWLFEIQRKISSFVRAFMVSESCLKTLKDLEDEVVVMLSSFDIPTIGTFRAEIQSQKSGSIDPNEIDIDAETLLTPLPSDKKASRFVDFGVGPLLDHPQVRLEIPINARTPISSAQVIATLIEFINHQDLTLGDRGPCPLVDVDAFVEYLLSKFHAVHLSELGVLSLGDLRGEVHLLSHVRAVRQQKREEAQRRAMEEMLKFHAAASSEPEGTSSNADTQTARGRGRGGGGCGRGGAVDMGSCRLAPPTRAPVASFVDACARSLDRRTPGATYSPSFSKLLQAVRDVIIPPPPTRPQKSKKRRRQGQGGISLHGGGGGGGYASGEGEDVEEVVGVMSKEVQEVVAQVCTEYCMLHLGGNKYFNKRLEWAQDHTEIETETETETEIEKDSEMGEALEESRRGGDEEVTVVAGETKGEKANKDEVEVEEGGGEEVVEGKKTITHNNNINSSGEDEGDNSGGGGGGGVEGKKARHFPGPSLPPRAITSVTSHRPSPPFEHRMTIHHTQAPALAPSTSTSTSTTTTTTASTANLLLPSHGSTSSSSSPPPPPPPPASSSSKFQHLAALLDSDPGLVHIGAGDLSHLAPWTPPGGTLDPHAAGRWGEALVYQFLLGATRGTDAIVQWVNEHRESKASYDILVTQSIKTPHGVDRRQAVTYVEVKSSRFAENNVFELSLQEWEFATKLPRVRYCIFRVFNAGDVRRCRIVVIPDVLRLISEHRVKMCLAI